MLHAVGGADVLVASNLRLLTLDDDGFRRDDSQFDASPLDRQHFDLDGLADEECFTGTAAHYEHEANSS